MDEEPIGVALAITGWDDENDMRAEAFEHLMGAVRELGVDFGGFSPVDLLLDNMPIDSETARELVEEFKHA